uniref:GRIP domain-containing protein n=1 Tax=Caenorhabditis tropicalis TaxID=1561998 RepID=A0A1I7UH26_9PELO
MALQQAINKLDLIDSVIKRSIDSVSEEVSKKCSSDMTEKLEVSRKETREQLSKYYSYYSKGIHSCGPPSMMNSIIHQYTRDCMTLNNKFVMDSAKILGDIEKKEEIDQLKMEISTLKMEKEEKLKENEQLRDQIRVKDVEEQKNITLMEKLNEENRNLHKWLATTLENTKKLGALVEDGNRKKEEMIKDLENRKNEELAEKEEKIKELEEKERLEKKSEEQRAKDALIEQLKEENRNLQKNLTVSLENSKTLGSLVEDGNRRITEKEKKIEELEEYNEEEDERIEELEALKETVARYERENVSKIEELNKEVTRMKKEMAIKDEQVEKWELKFESAEKKLKKEIMKNAMERAVWEMKKSDLIRKMEEMQEEMKRVRQNAIENMLKKSLQVGTAERKKLESEDSKSKMESIQEAPKKKPFRTARMSTGSRPVLMTMDKPERRQTRSEAKIGFNGETTELIQKGTEENGKKMEMREETKKELDNIIKPQFVFNGENWTITL